MKTKICTKCKQEKSLDEFSHRGVNRKGLRAMCNSCKNKEACKNRARNKKQNPEQYYKDNFKNNIKGKYGLTVEQWQQMFDEQDGCCAICRQPEINRNLGVDHRHSDGKVRSLLCCKCNLLVGIIETEFWGLKDKVAVYLEKHND